MLYIPTFSEHLLTNDVNKQVVKLSRYVIILYDELLVTVMLGKVVQKSVLADITCMLTYVYLSKNIICGLNIGDFIKKIVNHQNLLHVNISSYAVGR